MDQLGILKQRPTKVQCSTRRASRASSGQPLLPHHCFRISVIPAKKSHIFSTYQDNKAAVTFKFGGCETHAKENILLGKSWEESLEHLVAEVYYVF